ncbi:hypothetical protein AGLY_008760 [Aphis glycines]|uniref:Uncharacterized protein n=1 Tax=Aphis glycines TaxID=307491 RepID=A0A6G0TKS3_APHGL|nr:hypothetical protein AGLY_008760 [Aphis glycines]
MTNFNYWKKDIEEKELCQYVKSTSSKTNGDKIYIYYYCHRIMNKEYKSSKSGGSVKTGHVCPSNIKVNIDHQNIKANFCSTHLWHTHDIEKQRLYVENRSMIAKLIFCTWKLVLGVPVNRILDDIRSSDIEGGIKRIHLLEKQDIHNIKRSYNIAYKTKKHENDAISVNIWVNDMMAKGDESLILSYKQQGDNGNHYSCFNIHFIGKVHVSNDPSLLEWCIGYYL